MGGDEMIIFLTIWISIITLLQLLYFKANQDNFSYLNECDLKVAELQARFAESVLTFGKEVVALKAKVQRLEKKQSNKKEIKK